MDYTVETVGLFAAGAIFYAIVTNGWRAYAAKNVEILTVYDLEEMRLPTNDKDYSHIFTILNNEKRVAKAKVMLKQCESNMKEAQNAVEKRQDATEDERKQLNRLSNKVEDCETEGDQEIVIQNELIPCLKKLGAALDALSADLNGREILESHVLFWEHVSRGHPRTDVLENLVERNAVRRERDTKMKEAGGSAFNSLKLGDALMDKMIDKYVNKI